MKKLLCLGIIMIVSACGSARPAAMTDDGWSHYKESFVKTSGAVSDTGNENISHSEGQGYAMLLAVAYGDRQGFDRLWSWTRKHLQVRDDYLFAWRWSAESGVEDKNNASDGDVLIAWALYRAGKQWDDIEYSESALYIVRDIRRKLVHEVGDYWVLIPGEYGFVNDDCWTVNLSYWVYPALQELAILDRSPVWNQLIESGKQLTREASRGDWKLTPDWIDLYPGVPPRPSSSKPVRFGYEAVRLPLYLVWSGDFDEDIIQNSVNFWEATALKKYTPAWIDLMDGSYAEYEAPAGFKAVHTLSNLALNQKNKRRKDLFMSLNIKQQDYYSSSLILLSRLAYHERLKP